MKTLLILPLLIFLIACGGVEVEEVEEVEEVNNTPALVTEALEIFVFNKEILEDEVLFGALCLVSVIETGRNNDDACVLYYQTRETAINISKLGLDIFVGLYDEGHLAQETDYFEVVDIVERIADVELIAKSLRTRIKDEIEKTTSSQCVKCAIYNNA